MTTTVKSKLIRVLFGFKKLGPGNLQTQCNAVLDGVYADTFWTSLTPPIDKPTFKGAADSFSSLSTAALDGSKKAIAARNHQGTIVVQMLRQLAQWVEGACNQDLKTLLASGVQPATTTPTKVAPLTESIRKIEPGPNTGQVKIVLQDDPDALAYDFRWSQAVANGATPVWANQHIGLTRPPTIISGLVPGTSYVFQVRSITRDATKDWSDPITRICV